MHRMHAGAAPALLLCTALFAVGCAGTRVPAARPFDPDTIPEAYAHSTAALMWPGAVRAWQVTPAGDLYNGDWRVRTAVTSGADTAGPPRVVAFEDRWLPVARWTRRCGTLRCEWETVAAPARDPADSVLVASVEIVVTNTGSTPRPARLDLAIDLPATPEFVAWDAPEIRAGLLRVAAGEDTTPALAWSADLEGGTAADWTLAPGASRRARLLLPTEPLPARTLARWARVPHQRRVAEVRAYWTGAVARGAEITLGDPEVENALRAATVTLLALRERRGAAWVPIGNPFQYRDVWLRDGARAIRALAVLGHTDEARGLCAGFEGLQWPQGAFLSQRGQLDGTGQALWAFEQAMLRPAPAESVARYARLAERAWRWYEWQRDLGRRSGWTFGRMMPYGDPRDAELARAQLVGNDAWAIAGYRAAARLARAAGRAGLADEIERSRAAYVGDFRAALEREGGADVPPSWQGVGRDWGNLAAAWPCAALVPTDPRAAALARRVWATAGGAGLATYGTPDTLQVYYGADLGHWALLAGERGAADSVLSALLHWRSASGGAAELFSRSSRDFGANLPPHGTSAAALASLVRDALVCDDDDTLRLTLGARARWWEAGARVERAPTRWGLLDLAFRRAGDEAEWSFGPVPVWTALALPPGTRLAQAPAPLVRLSDTVVLAPPGTRRVGVRLVAVAP
jgi:hypothetical protein